HAGERLRRKRPCQRAGEVAMAEGLEVEEVGSGGGPETQRVDRLAAVTDHGPIERNADQLRGTPDDGPQRSSLELERAVQGNLDLLVGTSDFPGVRATKPVVRMLALPTAVDRLPEHSVLVPEPVSHRGQLHRRHRIEEARGETPKSAVSQTRVRFLFDQAEPVEGFLLDGIAHYAAEQEVRDVVRERTADEKFHR